MENGRVAAPGIMLLTTVRSYRLEAFRAAANRLGVRMMTGIDLPDQLAEQWPGALPLTFTDIEESTRRIAAHATEQPLCAILSVDDSGSLIAAAASAALGLPHNDPAAAEAARDKSRMRRLLKRGGVAVPWFRSYTTADDPAAVAAQAPYPCVVKPVNLNGSRGVMRADSPAELVVAIDRLKRLITAETDEDRPYLVETYLPGIEVALEGMLDNGRLTVLALFDKPEPLVGPFFEETIYVTPSRLPSSVQATIERTTADAARALGLVAGPMLDPSARFSGMPSTITPMSKVTEPWFPAESRSESAFRPRKASAPSGTATKMDHMGACSSGCWMSSVAVVNIRAPEAKASSTPASAFGTRSLNPTTLPTARLIPVTSPKTTAWSTLRGCHPSPRGRTPPSHLALAKTSQFSSPARSDRCQLLGG